MMVSHTTAEPAPSRLQVYLLGAIEFDALLRLQRRLVYEVSGDRTSARLILTEHPHAISVGRTGSREHIGFEPSELTARRWPVRWVNRGGGCLLHAPGQIAAYSIVALDRFQFDLAGYLRRLHEVAVEVAASFDVPASTQAGRSGVWSDGRLLIHLGVAVRDWIAYFGLTMNVCPDLEPFRHVRCDSAGDPPMTSLEREKRGAVRMATVRQRLIETFTAQFHWDHVALFHSHPALAATQPGSAAALRV